MAMKKRNFRITVAVLLSIFLFSAVSDNLQKDLVVREEPQQLLTTGLASHAKQFHDSKPDSLLRFQGSKRHFADTAQWENENPIRNLDDLRRLLKGE